MKLRLIIDLSRNGGDLHLNHRVSTVIDIPDNASGSRVLEDLEGAFDHLREALEDRVDALIQELKPADQES